MASPSHITSGVRSRRAHRDLCSNLILGHPQQWQACPLRHQLVAPHLAASMSSASAVAPCQSVKYFTHLNAQFLDEVCPSHRHPRARSKKTV